MEESSRAVLGGSGIQGDDACRCGLGEGFDATAVVGPHEFDVFPGDHVNHLLGRGDIILDFVGAAIKESPTVALDHDVAPALAAGIASVAVVDGWLN